MQNLFAHTEPGQDYPAYLSINKDDDGRHRVSVRSSGNGGRDLGEIHVSPETLEHMATDVLAAINGETPTASVSQDELYKAMVNRFLGWKLPADFGPDCGIEFTAHGTHESLHWPVGTNLFTAEQALEMFKHCLPAELIAPPADERECCGKCDKPAEQSSTLPPMPTPEQYQAAIGELAGRIRQADAVIVSLVQKAGGSVTVTGEDTVAAIGYAVEGEISEDRTAFTFRTVPVPQQVAQ